MTTDWSAKAKLTAYIGDDHSGAATICCERCDALLAYPRFDMGLEAYTPEPINGFTFEDGQWKPGKHLLDRLKRTGSLERRHKNVVLARLISPHSESRFIPIRASDWPFISLPAYFRCWNCEREGLNGLNVLKDDLWASLPNPR